MFARGVKRTGTNRTPGSRAAFNMDASFRPSSHGAPTSSNGVSVPRPTETFVVSSKPMPGYRLASVRLLMLGDGLTHTSIELLLAAPVLDLDHLQVRIDSALAIEKL